MRCLVRTARNEKHLPVDKVEIARGDLRHPDSVRKSLNGVDVLVNAAHIRFSHSIIPLCAEAGIRRSVFLSSTRRYTMFPCPSQTQVLEGEDAIRSSGLDYTILRPAMIYGGPRDNNITRLVNQIRKTSLFPLFGDGSNLIQPIFVEDLVDAVLFCLKNNQTIGKEYTLAGPEPISYRQAVEIIAAETGRKIKFIPISLGLCLFLTRIYQTAVRKPKITVEQVRRFGEDKNFDIETAKEELGFRPRSFEEGIRKKIAGKV